MRYSNYTLNDAWNKHQNCETVIYHKKFSNGDIVPGLYCKEFGLWIQWLDIKTADELILSGVEVVLTKPVKKKGHPIKRKQFTVKQWLSGEELGI